MKNIIFEYLLIIAGICQIVMALSSLFIPKMLNWNKGLEGISILLRQMFWVYAAYIFVTNIGLGLVSILLPKDLLSGSALGKFILGYTALYWLARVGVQFFYFDIKAAPKGVLYKLGEVALVANFIFLSLVYICTFCFVFINIH